MIKNFLETYPLYRKLSVDLPSELEDLTFPNVNLHCSNCNSEETFTLANKYGEIIDQVSGPGKTVTRIPSSPPIAGEVILLEYVCARCNEFKWFYFLRFGETSVYMQKIGQFPPYGIDPGKNITKMLGEHVYLFKKGLICESQSYGIGAYAYYRRIVELIIDELLNSIGDLIDENDKKDYEEALSKTKKTKNASEKIELVKDLLPKRLRPENVNPLATLHEKLSKGIHEKSDEECIEDAEAVRTILIYLVGQIIESGESSKQFTESMKKILNKKNKK